METDEAPKPKKAPYKSKRYFLSSLNTYFGYQLVQLCTHLDLITS